MCRWTCTLGGPRWLDEWLAALEGVEYVELPTHRCQLPAGHEGKHTDGDLTWTATTVEIGIRIPS